MLLLIGSQPVGYRHAHAGGDELHHHSGCELCQHHNHDEDCHDEDWHDDGCHAQADDEADHEEADHEEQLLAGSTWHVHLTFLGWSLCIPGEDVPHDHDPEGPSVESVLIVSEPFVANNGPSVATRYDIPSQAFLALPVRPEHEQLAKRPPPVTSPPLCDVARRELTGVLLI